jgi:hypothetical protein
MRKALDYGFVRDVFNPQTRPHLTFLREKQSRLFTPGQWEGPGEQKMSPRRSVIKMASKAELLEQVDSYEADFEEIESIIADDSLGPSEKVQQIENIISEDEGENGSSEGDE